MEKVKLFSTKLNELTVLVNNTLLSIDQKTDDLPNAFFYTLAFKTNNSLQTVNFLIGEMMVRRHFSDSIFLILRTMLSDTISYFYLIILGSKEENEEESDRVFLEAIYRLEADHLRYSFKNLQVYQCLYNATNEEIEQRRKKIRSMFPAHFETDGSFKRNLRMENMTEMVKTIAKSEQQWCIEIIKRRSSFTIFFQSMSI